MPRDLRIWLAGGFLLLLLAVAHGRRLLPLVLV